MCAKAVPRITQKTETEMDLAVQRPLTESEFFLKKRQDGILLISYLHTNISLHKLIHQFFLNKNIFLSENTHKYPPPFPLTSTQNITKKMTILPDLYTLIKIYWGNIMLNIIHTRTNIYDIRVLASKGVYRHTVKL